MVLHKNFPNILIYDDIKTCDFIDHVDLLTGGFPCQSFSVAGKRKGIDDPRYLWPEMLRIIKQCKPSWVVAENVAGILEMEIDNILADLEKENYQATAFIIPACAANAPHRRDRVWIIANADGERFDLWSSSRKERYLQDNIERDLTPLQSKWSQFQPLAWETYTAQDWFDYNTRVSGANDGLSDRLHRLKALGNAIVPQTVYPILALIAQLENEK